MTAKPRRGKPGTEEAPTAIDEPPKAEPVMSDQAKDQPKDQAKDQTKGETSKEEGTAKSNDSGPEAARLATQKDTSAGEQPLGRRDPVPPVTPAPPAVASGPSDAAASPKVPAATAEAPAVTASAPPAPMPAGPPTPPISR